EVEQPDFYAGLTAKTQYLLSGLLERAKASGIGLQANYLGGLFGLFFTDEAEIIHLAQVQRCQMEQFKQFFHAMLQAGIYFAPSAFEAGCMSAAHEESELQATLEAAEQVFEGLKKG